MQRSKLLLGSVVTLAVLGLGAGAFALDGSSGDAGTVGDGTTTTVEPSTTTSTVAPTTTTTAPAPDTGAAVDAPTDEPADDEGAGQGVERSTEGCGGGSYANHGEYVSSIAHDPDRQPGDVAAAAHSDCGKPISAVGGEGEVPAPEVPGAESPGNGNGNGNAYGKNK